MNQEIYVGKNRLQASKRPLAMKKVSIDEEDFYLIENFKSMKSFLMTIVSHGDQWMYISSTGGLTCGRKNAESALFPYVTDDKVHDSYNTTGPETHLLLEKSDRQILWSPFSKSQEGIYDVSENLYKSVLGNKIVFEAINHDLKVTFKYCWKYSDAFGFVRESGLINNSGDQVTIKVLDGIRNILPYGVTTLLQTTKSTLLDGYKRCELDAKTGLGIYTLSSTLTDKAEPSESLKATSVWSYGLEKANRLLCEDQISSFLKTGELVAENDIKGKRGAYYVSDIIKLEAGSDKNWFIVAELNQSGIQIEALIDQLSKSLVEDEKAPYEGIMDRLLSDIKKGDQALRKHVFEADGLQCSGNDRAMDRHFSNTLFNIMRGGLYADGYDIDRTDLVEFAKSWNQPLCLEMKDFFDGLPQMMNYEALLKRAKETNHPVLIRIMMEYLPITYSRRHGDPSRPWNKFNIDITKEDGSRKLQFEGNWRDIFQNWEALSLSYPAYIEGIIGKFVNASTADGYNPYRITKDGIDWEVLDPDEPWSNIGYWGDHQLIYLLKLLELSKKYNGSKLDQLMTQEVFVYGNVPYRIAGIEDLIKDPRNSISFDDDQAAMIEERVKTYGADGKLVFAGEDIHRVNLMEKLLVTLLTKLSNYVPEGGIWMNTQRPEWNDANNALVGYGLSMVTLYYLHRFLVFMDDFMKKSSLETIMLSEEVFDFFQSIKSMFADGPYLLGAKVNDSDRFKMVTKLGKAGEVYRKSVYNGFSGQKKSLESQAIVEFIQDTTQHMKDAIVKNKREDGLYHSYNLIKFKERESRVSHLYEMLEGQVALLSSKSLKTDESVSLLKALKNSRIYRQDQNSYMLYPNKALPEFLDKNIIPEERVFGSKVLSSELEKAASSIIQKDIHGHYRFDGKFRNGDDLKASLLALGGYDTEDVLEAEEIFSDIFNHHEFTGRSGTFYKYEGLGCIYWHMVSKLLLAVEENAIEAFETGNPVAGELADFYTDIKAGIGAEKSPDLYGAFPTDAYSHTPGFAGVQQPGMTGQVKEDIISRFGELGISVEGGRIQLKPYLLESGEFLTEEKNWKLFDGNIERTIKLEAGEFGFTYCTVPFIYRLGSEDHIAVYDKEGQVTEGDLTSGLSQEISKHIFSRNGQIDHVEVVIKSA